MVRLWIFACAASVLLSTEVAAQSRTRIWDIAMGTTVDALPADELVERGVLTSRVYEAVRNLLTVR